ncbi:hypothetical protein QBC40DRAFT_95859 [Triangularia verruculosa]|uniref:Uncharacterized protein n=1 Tax=Triangularia verruculosa TaxID=2587418 RepID=A0AAN6XDM1_9PEZI|nr:hypothetical protein QBC40DRAFT_95859 [Triangularia verruculosa]
MLTELTTSSAVCKAVVSISGWQEIWRSAHAINMQWDGLVRREFPMGLLGGGRIGHWAKIGLFREGSKRGGHLDRGSFGDKSDDRMLVMEKNVWFMGSDIGGRKDNQLIAMTVHCAGSVCCAVMGVNSGSVGWWWLEYAVMLVRRTHTFVFRVFFVWFLTAELGSNGQGAVFPCLRHHSSLSGQVVDTIAVSNLGAIYHTLRLRYRAGLGQVLFASVIAILSTRCPCRLMI